MIAQAGNHLIALYDVRSTMTSRSRSENQAIPEISPVPTGQPARRWSLAIVLMLVIFTIFEITYLTMHVRMGQSGSDRLFGDFFAFWSYAQFIHVLPADQIYDVAALQAFQQTLPGGSQDFYYPCVYP